VQELAEAPKYSTVNVDDEIGRMVYRIEKPLYPTHSIII
jgi:hypothetical protein